MRYKNLSLKNQIEIVIGLFICVILIMGVSYYLIVTQILQRKENIYMDNMINQIEQKIVSSTEELQQYSALISNYRYTSLMLTEKTPSLILKYNEILNDMIANTVINNNRIDSVCIVGLEENIYGYLNKNLSIIDQLDAKYNILNYESHISRFSGLIYNDFENKYYYAYFNPIFDNCAGAKINNKIGTLVILSNISNIQSVINNVTTTENSVFMILDSSNEVIVSNKSNYQENVSTAKKASSLFLNKDGKQIDTVINEKSIIKYKAISSTGWNILSISPISEINADLNHLLLFGVVFVSMILFTILILCMKFIVSFTNPIAKMVGFMNKGAYHNLHNRLVIKEQNEIGHLAAHINYMLDEIDSVTKKSIQTQSNMYEMDLAKKRAELSALQSQINPHFLYNTLDCIKGYGYLLKSQEIIEITDSLSAIMRYSIKGAEIVSVNSELNCVRKYLKIISIRFEDRFEFNIQIDDVILDLNIPRFILQPIIENAIHHGLEPKLSNGILSLYGHKKDSEIIFIVKDNGKGIPSHKFDELRKNLEEADPENAINTYNDRSIGLLNINGRLKFLYGKEYGLKITSTENEGTSVQINIPL